ncbi:flagellar biosynthesis protein FlhF [Iodobacter ciconiae]|uniref:Flagellar biosynthesis protein FlhF n=1 Tax=Iodobacter ciconiae TaxID=2496266 RepID=A0A3S8ZWQ2_9NEIS|nr:flagellar biosynthesis protein FlhF [Iodobacter ciconiae]AZN37930.1 flagellar biosynthesis protein FlhF [Iodobacter ciconiae]
MVVKKFYGATTRDALRQVRDELGPDALILSNRQVSGGGIEIMAVADADVAALTNNVATQPRPAAQQNSRGAQNGARLLQNAQAAAPISKALARSYAIPDDDDEESGTLLHDEPVVLRSNRTAPRQPEPVAAAIPLDSNPEYQQPRPSRPAPRPSAPPPRRPAPERALPTFSFEDDEAPPVQSPADKEAMDGIAREIRLLRGLLESQLAGMAWGELSRHAPEKLEALRQLLSAGFCPALSRQLVEKMPAQMTLDQGMRWVKAALTHNLAAATTDDDLINRGGIYALIGPTGVGKTTTVAKLAARCALLHGPDSVALLTTDSYRIGAHDQLRIYGRIIGVPVHEVKDETDLQFTLADLSEKHLVLIDTVGMGQRDQRISEQLALFDEDNVSTLLLLAANAQTGTLDDVARRYRNTHLAGCILTKLDETMNLGGCLDVAIRHKLRLHFLTNGQRVPEDLHRANVAYLVDRAFRGESQNSAFTLKPDEFPLFMGAQGGTMDSPLDFNINYASHSRG